MVVKRKIVLFSTHAQNAHEMAAIRLQRLIPALVKEWDVTLICPPDDASVRPGAIKRLSFILRGAVRAARTLRKQSQAVVVATIPAFEALVAGTIVKLLLG